MQPINQSAKYTLVSVLINEQVKKKMCLEVSVLSTVTIQCLEQGFLLS